MKFRKVPFSIRVLILCAYTSMFIGVYHVLDINEFLGILSYISLIISMRSDNITSLRLWGALAGSIFVIQFIIADMPLINIVAQLGLVIYGIYKAVSEIKAKKNFTNANNSDKIIQGKGIL